MSEEPLEPVEPEPVEAEPVTDAVPTEPVPTAGPPPWPDPTRPEAAKGSSSTVAVPKWLLLVVGALVIAGLGFAAGWIAAPGDGSSDTRAVGPIPGFDRGGNGGGAGDLPTIPTLPRQGADGPLLGVTTTRSTDPSGARVRQVLPGSPAADAGLKTDDVITKVDDDAIANPTQLATRIQAHEVGDTVTITYVRDGDTATKEIRLARRSSFGPSTPSTTQPEF